MLRDIRFFLANFTITPSNSVNTSALNFINTLEILREKCLSFNMLVRHNNYYSRHKSNP